MPLLRHRPEIVGHRGAPRELVENTIPSFVRAVALGVDAVELDVHATRDGTVVVHHDVVPRARRPDGTSEARPIVELTADELRMLRFDDGSGIPALDELLDLLGPGITPYVELKGHGIEDAVLAVLARHDARAALHSFDHRAVRRVSLVGPGVRCGILLSSYVLDVPALMRAAGALDVWQEWAWIDRALVDTVHDAGGRVVAWTVNDPDAMRGLAAMGVDALCTDLPDVALAALA